MRMFKSILIISGLLLVVCISIMIKVKPHELVYHPTSMSDRIIDVGTTHFRLPGIYGGDSSLEKTGDFNFAFIMPTGDPIRIGSQRSDNIGINKFPIYILHHFD
jgi:hypothetical protein